MSADRRRRRRRPGWIARRRRRQAAAAGGERLARGRARRRRGLGVSGSGVGIPAAAMWTLPKTIYSSRVLGDELVEGTRRRVEQVRRGSSGGCFSRRPREGGDVREDATLLAALGDDALGDLQALGDGASGEDAEEEALGALLLHREQPRNARSRGRREVLEEREGRHGRAEHVEREERQDEPGGDGRVPAPGGARRSRERRRLRRRRIGADQPTAGRGYPRRTERRERREEAPGGRPRPPRAPEAPCAQAGPRTTISRSGLPVEVRRLRPGHGGEPRRARVGGDQRRGHSPKRRKVATARTPGACSGRRRSAELLRPRLGLRRRGAVGAAGVRPQIRCDAGLEGDGKEIRRGFRSSGRRSLRVHAGDGTRARPRRACFRFRPRRRRKALVSRDDLREAERLGPAPPVPEPGGVRALLRLATIDVGPLRRHRDFRLLFVGQGVSAFGSMITYVALPYQAYQLTGSSLVGRPHQPRRAGAPARHRVRRRRACGCLRPPPARPDRRARARCLRRRARPQLVALRAARSGCSSLSARRWPGSTGSSARRSTR